MHKSSIYLPAELKADLAALAARSGRAEADLIRQAIERMLALSGESGEAAVPAEPVMRRPGPVLVGVGLGPGDPRQVTALARTTLLGAHRVFAVSWTSRSIGRAEAVVRAVAPTVAVVTLGDPGLWSVFGDLAAEITEQRVAVAVEMVPGIAPFQALAAATGTVLARPGQRVVVLDGPIPDAVLAEPANAVVVYKGSDDAERLREQARSSGRLDRARVGELLGLAGERIEHLDDLGEGPVSYLATVILPAADPR